MCWGADSTGEGSRWPTPLEWAGIHLVGLARNGAGFDIALGAERPSSVKQCFEG